MLVNSFADKMKGGIKTACEHRGKSKCQGFAFEDTHALWNKHNSDPRKDKRDNDKYESSNVVSLLLRERFNLRDAKVPIRLRLLFDELWRHSQDSNHHVDGAESTEYSCDEIEKLIQIHLLSGLYQGLVTIVSTH